MSYKVTLEVFVNAQVTFPTIKVESERNMQAIVQNGGWGSIDKPADTEALEGVLTRTREFAETLTRGVQEVES